MVNRLVIILIALACGPSASDIAYVRSDHCPVSGCVEDAGHETGPVTIPPEALEDWDTQGAGPLSGIFAVEAVINAKVVVPVTLRQILRLRIVQKGETIHQKTTLCAFKLPVVQDVATLVIPPLLQTLIQTKTTESTGEYLHGAAYVPPPFLVVVGAQLANPATDKLPTMADPTGAIDEDADGQTGVTLTASVLTCPTEQQLYVALRTTGNLSGTFASLDTIAGQVTVHLDENVLGYSDPCMSVAANIRIDVLPKSPFRAVRVGPTEDVDQNGNVSCAELVVNAPRLFGPEWTP